MGDRYILELDCAYCKHTNVNVLYAFEWGEWFKCVKCKKRNGVAMSFKAKKAETEDKARKLQEQL